MISEMEETLLSWWKEKPGGSCRVQGCSTMDEGLRRGLLQIYIADDLEIILVDDNALVSSGRSSNDQT